MSKDVRWDMCGRCGKKFSQPEFPHPAQALKEHYDLKLCPGPRTTAGVTVQL